MKIFILLKNAVLPKTNHFIQVGVEISATAFDMGWEGRWIRTSTRMEVSPDYFFSLEATIEGEEGGVKPEQAELWGRLEERWFWAGGFWVRSFQ